VASGLRQLAARVRRVFGKLSRLDKVFLVLLALALAGTYGFSGSGWSALLVFLAFVFGLAAAFRWLFIGFTKAIWRLRYRLIAAYVFIGVVPILLILSLAGIAAYILSGQIAAYLVSTEIDRRAAALDGQARGIAHAPPAQRLDRARWMTPYLSERFPGFEMLVRDGISQWRYPEGAAIEPPPAGWHDASGLLRKGDAHYLWAHVVHGSVEVLMMAPMDSHAFSQLVPALGDVGLTGRRPVAAQPGNTGLLIRSGDIHRDNLPKAVNRFDFQVVYPTLVLVSIWETPNRTETAGIGIRTRYSAILRTIFAQKATIAGLSMSWMVSLLFTVVAALLLIVELLSIFVGVRITRTMTRAVHNLYEGTQRVGAGDFSHRIEVRGNDQLAALGVAFNKMTADLERLVQVAKEKERLQSEIEIAREVQNQLFPKAKPISKTLELVATCQPARLISGDYYDFMNLQDSQIALAIGDVSGKGISAALLMATVQSTMRTQLRAARERAAAAGNGGGTQRLSTAALVTRLNQQLHAYTPPEKFATFCLALYDDASGKMTYTNAGHLPPILLRNGQVTRLDVNGTVVGAFDFSQYGESSCEMKPGDLLVCFTDGISEPENEFGEQFGEDRLTDVIAKNQNRSCEEIIAAIMDSVRVWTGSPELQDDMTLLVARRV
jgi:sigma-B regulation protein RsbU (phosphoserine phosphatase)